MSSVTDMIVKAKAFNPTSVSYLPAKVDSRGGKKVMLKHSGQPLVIQVPLMFTWGMNERVDENSGRVSYDTNLVFEVDKSSSIAKFRDKMQELQDKLIDDAVQYSKEWFGKNKLSREVAEAMMYPILKYPNDKQSGEPDTTRNPSMKLKIPYWDGKFNIELYDMQSKALYLPAKDGCDGPQGDKSPLDFMPKATYVKGLVQCNGIWMAGGRFGVTWKLIQAQVRPPVRLVGTGTCHIDDDSDDDEMLSMVQKQEEEQEDDNGASNGPTFSDGSDDNDVEEEEEEEEVVVEKPKPKKKKVIRRRKKTSGD